MCGTLNPNLYKAKFSSTGSESDEARTKLPRISTSRITILLIALQLAFGVLIGRLFLVQFLHSEVLCKRSEDERRIQISGRAKRGKILDRHHNILALNRDLVSVYADPKFLNTEPRKIAGQLSLLLGVSESRIMTLLEKKQRRFVWLARNLGYDRLADIQRITRQVRGLGYQIHGRRFYPKDDRACHVIGYTNFANEGMEGIEHQHNPHLLGRGERSGSEGSEMPEKLLVYTDGKKRPISPPAVYEAMPGYGSDVVLTIDENIQFIAERELSSACKTWRAEKGTVVVMHSKTGEILALANYPNYNLNDYSASRESTKRNHAIWMQYEPGSVFKIVVAAAALNEKVATPTSIEYCEAGEYRLPNGHTIHDVKPNGWLTLSDIIEKSSNIGVVKIASRLSKVQLEEYTHRFGFGRKTGIDLPYEKRGSLRGFDRWDGYSASSVPFGQGISVTPIQMLNAINVIATNGILLEPYITKNIHGRNGQSIEHARREGSHRIISSESAAQVKQMLVKVTESGAGQTARVDGYRVAGKTGTAQKAKARLGYVKGKVVTTFAGFLPAEDPKISIIVVVDEPAGGALSSRVTAPIFRKIAHQTMSYLNQTDLFAQLPMVNR